MQDLSEVKSSEKDWRDLAAAATAETDLEKLGRIIKELCGVLEKRQAQKTFTHQSSSLGP